MVNTDERTEQSEIGGLLVLIIIYFKYFWEMDCWGGQSSLDSVEVKYSNKLCLLQ